MRVQASFGLLTVALIGSAVMSAPAAGQSAPERVELRGAVVDATSGEGLRGASITIGGNHRVITNVDGRFQVRDLRPGSYPVQVTQLGYDTLRVTVEVGKEQALVLQLEPDPVVLERVTVMVDRFASRRNAIGSSVRFFTSDQLHGSDAYSVWDFLNARGSLRFTGCGSPLAMNACARVRGRVSPVTVYLDGVAVVGGGEILSALRPDEIYNLEIIGGGRSIRLYTNWYIEAIADGRRPPPGYLF